MTSSTLVSQISAYEKLYQCLFPNPLALHSFIVAFIFTFHLMVITIVPRFCKENTDAVTQKKKIQNIFSFLVFSFSCVYLYSHYMSLAL